MDMLVDMMMDTGGCMEALDMVAEMAAANT